MDVISKVKSGRRNARVFKDFFDVIIRTKCAHATTNRTKVITRLRSLLNDQGFIVLSEVTQLIDWYDIVFGLLDGWWLADDGSTYPLEFAESWVNSFVQAGFIRNNVSYSKGPDPDSNTQRLLVASNKHQVSAELAEEGRQPGEVQTVIYKTVDEIDIQADMYFPPRDPVKAMPVGTSKSSALLHPEWYFWNSC